MDYNAFEVFITVTEEMNFTRAAARLYMSQQNVSSHILKLEKNYRVTLFERKPVLRLTPEGEAFLSFAKMVMEGHNALTSRFADLSTHSIGLLRMGISYQRSQVFMPGIWSRFHHDYGNISLRMQEQMTYQLLEQLQSGELDLIVGVNIPQFSNLKVIPLAQEATYCTVSEATLRQYFPEDWQERIQRYSREGLDLLDIKDLPLMLPSNDNRLRAPIDRIFSKNNVYPNVVLETASHGLLSRLSALNGQVALVSPLTLYELLRTTPDIMKICHSFKVKDIPPIEVSLAYRSDIDQPRYVLGMVDCVTEEFAYYIHELNTRFG